ncbi:MAG: glycosyltransferase [Sphingobacteriales bacterium]|nr:MAG: glycosyltransferase [Sphingobacteriales bacterium]
MMRVLHVIDKLDVGGAEKVFLDLTHLLANSTIEIGALLFDDSGALTSKMDARVTLYRLKRTNKYSLIKLLALHKISSKYDIVHAHMRHVYRYVRLAQLIFGGKYKLVLHDHYGIDQDIPTSVKGIFKPRYYIGVCTSLTDWAKSKLGIPSDNVYTLANTIIPTATSKYTSSSRSGNAIMVANISRVKNISFAIDLCGRTSRHLDIYGQSRDEAYRTELQRQIANNPKVRIIDDVTDFSGLYNRYDLAIHSSMSESGPLVLLEYLAAGIPFIAYKTGEVAATVYNDLPMLFMNSFNIDEWINKIEEIRVIEDLPEKMRMVFNKYFSTEKYTSECLRIYERIDC